MIKKITEALPSTDSPLIPTKIKPTCAIEEKARNRFIFCWRKANRFPVIIVSTETRYSILYQLLSNPRNTLYNTDTSTKSTDPFEITDKYEVTATGDPS